MKNPDREYSMRSAVWDLGTVTPAENSHALLPVGCSATIESLRSLNYPTITEALCFCEPANTHDGELTTKQEDAAFSVHRSLSHGGCELIAYTLRPPGRSAGSMTASMMDALLRADGSICYRFQAKIIRG